jgi:hypothetical protein
MSDDAAPAPAPAPAPRAEPDSAELPACQAASDTAPRWYELDAHDRLIAVDPAWDDFALANDGVQANSALVLGRPLRDFLSDDATLMFVEALLQAARLTRRARSVAYRCDGPGQMRRFLMTATPFDNGHVRVEHALQCSEARAPAPHYRSARNARWLRCSQCLALREPGLPWIPVDLLPPHLLAVSEREVTYGVCGDCLCLAGGTARTS